MASFTKGGQHHEIKALNTICTCHVRYSDCCVCIHMYTCTCLDATLHYTICKHVHLLNILHDNLCTSTSNNPHTTQEESPINNNTLEYFQKILQSDNCNSAMDKAEWDLNDLVDEVRFLAKECKDVDTQNSEKSP